MEISLSELGDTSLSFLIKEGVDDAVVAANRSLSHQIRFSNNEVSISKRWHTINLSVYLAKDKKIAYTDLNDISSIDRVTTALKDLLSFVNSMKENPEFRGISEGPFDYQNIPQTYDPSIKDLSDYAIDNIEEAINAAMAEGATSSAGVLEWLIGEEFLKTTGGVEVDRQRTHFLFQMRSFLTPTESGQGICVGRDLNAFNAAQAGQNAGQLARQSRGGKPAKGGTFNAIFSPTVVGDIIGKAIAAANPFSFESGQSWLRDKLGQQISSEEFSAYDDGTIPNGFRSAKADAEGVPAQKTLIIENGILKGLIHNTNTARKADTDSTGNAGLILPQNTNISITPGEYSFDELIAESKSPTIYVSNCWYTRATSPIEGIFSSIPRDAMFLVENGEIQKPLRELRISDSYPNVMNNIVAIQNKVRQIKWWLEVITPVFAPAILVKDVRFTTGTQ